jgi:Fic family protein
VRGVERRPGEFRTSQNWIGSANAPLSQASFVPPPVHEMQAALDNFERFLHSVAMPALVQCGLAHAQFETIHPFLDGNGRVGRLLITFLLVHRRVLQRPLLYVSHYLKRYRAEYYDRLMAIREAGDWEGWLRFFLRGVAETAEEATATARAIVGLREQHRALLQDEGVVASGLRLLDVLFQQPLVHVDRVKEHLGIGYDTANRLVARFERLGLLDEITGGQRGRVYRYTPYLALFDERENASTETALMQTTESEGMQ